MDCPRCGARNETDVGSCLSCGAALSEDESLPTIAQKPLAAPPSAKVSTPRLAQGAPPKQCPNCMTLNAATIKFCARCGTLLAPPAVPPMAGATPNLVPGKQVAPPRPAVRSRPPVAPRPAPPPPPKP